MPNLTVGQYDLSYNAMSFTIAVMGAAFVFFLLARGTVAYKYQRVLEVGALITGVACYHYVRIFAAWTAAYSRSTSGGYTGTNELFNEGYRYADWLLTVPLLLVELIAILYITNQERGSLLNKLVIAAALMIVLGYPGEVSSDTTTRLIWGTLSTIPFVYILAVLWREVGATMARETPEVRARLSAVRLLLLASWGVYPIAYLLPLLGLDEATGLVGRQVGYSIADVIAKPLYGLMIYGIIRIKSQEEKENAPAGAYDTSEGIHAGAQS
ncbi:MAG: bacteriorhodopsin [Cytophagales bacterium]|nr:bacteriorhodopsin [Armatimonadota bacterium]